MTRQLWHRTALRSHQYLKNTRPQSHLIINLFIKCKHKLVVQLLSCVQLFTSLWTAACQPSLSITNSQSLFKLMSIELAMASNHLILCGPLLLLLFLFPSIRVFSNDSVPPIRWPKYWSFSISPSNEYSGLISFRTDWFPMDCQESSPTPQLESIKFLALSLLYGPTLTSIHDYWKNHSFD